jgi:hypothetical protein
MTTTRPDQRADADGSAVTSAAPTDPTMSYTNLSEVFTFYQVSYQVGSVNR